MPAHRLRNREAAEHSITIAYIAMKRVISKRAKNNNNPSPDLSAFQVQNTIQEASSSTNYNNSSSPRKIFNTIINNSPLRKSNPSQASLATNTSFATANEQIQASITPASQFYVDSSEDETTIEEGYNDLLSTVLSKPTPSEISFSSNPEQEIIMPKKTTVKTYPTATTVPNTTAPPAPATEKAVTKPAPVDKDAVHFDVAQNTYGCVKDIWAWGTTVPVVSNVLGLTETVAAKVLDVAVHMDLPAIDQQFVVPTCKKLDDDIVTPAISAVIGVVMGAHGKADDLVIKPVMTEVVPRLLAPLSMFDDKKAEEKAITAEATPVALN